MNRVAWGWLRLFGAAAVLGLVVWRVGTGPFLDGIRTINGWTLLAALAITAVTTACSAWRWRTISQRLGVALSLPAAIMAYYRSQFLNSALPGGVVGDVHRAIRHGHDSFDMSHALRAVAWERTAGQLVQAVLAAIVLLVLPSPVRSSMAWVIAGAFVIGGLLVLAAQTVPADRPSPLSRFVRAIRTDVRAALVQRAAWPAITVASLIAVTGYAALFIIAARTAAPTAPLAELLPIAMLVLLAMTIPLSVGGWGPREGIAAWAFSGAGLGASSGVAAATTYGVLSFAAVLPGAIVLIVESRALARPLSRLHQLASATHG